VASTGMRIQPYSATENLSKLKAFRQAIYQNLGPARDALFELGDAVLLTPINRSFPELSLSPVFRRKWGSAYEAIEDGRPNQHVLLGIYLEQMGFVERPILAGDHTAWPRLSARTLRDRTFEHQPTPIPGTKPITVGHGFSTLVWIPNTQGSWALPLLHERIPSEGKPTQTAAVQLRQVCRDLPHRPIVLLDSEYGCAPFLKDSADIPCDKVIRLRPNLCLRKMHSAYRGWGRPAIHGKPFRFRDARTWGKPLDTLDTRNANGESVQLSLWPNLHFQGAPLLSFWVLRIEQISGVNTRRRPRVLWLAWSGESPPPLAQWWEMYFRRFAVDHWYRFAKQSLGWTLPQFRTPEQEERWSHLMPELTWQLYLSRSIIQDRPLPWQKTQTVFSPGRVKQSLGGLFMRIGTPTCEPKPRGKSPGWEKGRPRASVHRYSIVRKC
jgi:hypothetical protein